jgi:hypothetical protein
MTFQCAVGPHTSEPKEKEIKIVTERRPKTYHLSDGRYRSGWEIVKETSYCQMHAKIKLG